MISSRVMWISAVMLLPIVAAGGTRAAAPVDLRIVPATARAPADIEVKATVEPDARNRSIDIVVESTDFYRASTIEIEGDRAARMHSVRFRQLPEGRYAVSVIVSGSRGEERAAATRSLSVY